MPDWFPAARLLQRQQDTEYYFKILSGGQKNNTLSILSKYYANLLRHITALSS